MQSSHQLHFTNKLLGNVILLPAVINDQGCQLVLDLVVVGEEDLFVAGRLVFGHDDEL